MVRLGYKETDAGVIPEEWDVKNVASFCKITTGDKNTQDRIKDGRYPFFVRSKDVESINSYSFDGEAVLTAGDGVGTGKIFHYIDGKFDYHQRVYNMHSFNEEVDAFYFYKFFSENFYDRIMQMTAKSSVDSVRREMIADMKVVLPPLLEQKAIAKALSDVDELIAGLEALIAKKRDLKTATMQQVLTGKTRLPGFSGSWVTRKLEEISTIKTGSKNNQDKMEDGEFPFFVRSENIEAINTYSYDCEAILVPGEGRIGEIFHYIKGKFDVHQRVYVINNFSDDVCAAFVHAYMTKFFGAHAMENSVKATVDSLRLPTFQKFEVSLPPTFEEQEAIAGILDEQNREILTLKERLAKSQAIKKGMMQGLLTGRTRLI